MSQMRRAAYRPRAATRRRMTVSLLLLFVLFLHLFGSLSGSYAFISQTLDEVNPKEFGRVIKWNLDTFPGGIIPYWVNLNRPPGATPFEPTDDPSVILAKVRNAFQAWENVPGSRVQFSFQGLINRTNARDGMLVVTFWPTGYDFPKGRPVWPICLHSREAGIVLQEGDVVLEAQFPGQWLD